LGLWLLWIVVAAVGPGLLLAVPANLRQMPPVAAPDPAHPAAATIPADFGLILGIAVGIAVLGFVLQWAVLRAWVPGLSVGSWLLALIGGTILAVVVVGLVLAAVYAIIERDTLAAGLPSAGAIQQFGANPFLNFVADILAVCCLAYTQGRTLLRRLGEVALGPWLWANFAGALLMGSLTSYVHKIGGGPGLPISDPQLAVINAAIFGAVTGIGLLSLLRARPYVPPTATYSFA
ncbi:MAG: hypothetical protein M3Z04_12065, partial [Chloroflexota bacterium]|nr:hypothetical protein [Chloroflexota bacterium]